MDIFDANILLVLSNALLLVLLIVQNIRLSRKSGALAIENISINSDLSALCRGATNIDRRLELVDSQIKRVMDRQEKFETSDSVKREYDHAIRAIRSGASVDRLVNMHGLSLAEARLLVSIHGEACEA